MPTPEIPSQPAMKKTLGLTGLTMNAMALIAPGAFLWLTFAEQCQYGAPMAGISMWFGIVAALLLCFATAISYAELSKLYPGAGSSYFFAEQAFLSKTRAYKFARLSKFIIGWASHLYYWVYPGVMVGLTAVLVGYVASFIWPTTFSSSVNSPTLMIGFCIVFSLGVAYIAYRGVSGTTSVNVAINIIQIAALIVFSAIAIHHRLVHKEGERGLTISNGIVVDYQVDSEEIKGKDGKPIPDTWPDGTAKLDAKGAAVNKTSDRVVKKDDLKSMEFPLPAGIEEGDPYPVLKKDEKTGALLKDKDGKVIPEPVVLSYSASDAVTGQPSEKTDPVNGPQTCNFHSNAVSVILPHSFNYIIIQACIAILILVGFESVTAMGEESRNAKRDIPRAVMLSLLIQGVLCYLVEYFAANYFLNSGYKIPQAAGSSAPIGDIMLITGYALFGSNHAARAYMLIQALTVFLALIGTTLSCISAGARVTYAMGRDDEVPSHFGLLHGKTLTPHRAIWTLAILSAAIGIFAVLFYLCGPAATPAMDSALSDEQSKSFWYPSFLVFSSDQAANIPNSVLVVTLVSNFGTFMLYMLTCIVAIVAFVEHQTFNGFKHFFVPIFGLLANLACMIFYIVGPKYVTGMSWKEPYVALAVAGVWGLYGAAYFLFASKSKGKPVLLAKPDVSPTA
jgi:amino acid transporter